VTLRECTRKLCGHALEQIVQSGDDFVYTRRMFLLPLGHQENTVRRLPWISLGILLTCVAMQIYASAVEPSLQRALVSLLEERFTLEQKLIAEHLARDPSDGKKAPDVEGLLQHLSQGIDPRALRKVFASDEAEQIAKLKAGRLTEPGDERFTRYQAIEDDLKAVEAQMPAMRFGYKPAEGGLRSMLTSIFAHIGWLHLIGNMWFLYLVGCNLEDRWGGWQFSAFYLIAGCVAAGAFGVMHAGSMEPLIGASGAVAGAMGAFMVCYARTRVKMFYVYILFIKPRWGTFRVPTWFVLGLWMAQQLVMTVFEARAGSAVAYSAHAAGFAFGVIVALLLRATGVDEALDRASARAAEGPTWEAHPSYLRAMEACDRQDHETARTLLHDLLKESPEHANGHEMLLDMYFEGKTADDDLFDVDLALPFLIDHYHKTRLDEPLVALYRRLRHQLPAYGLTDQELLRVATAAHHGKESVLVIAAVTEMMTEHPASTALARAMLLAAEVQGRSGAPDLQRDTLQRIVDQFPEHACAKLARDELASSAV
jgi:membrane associated rhomboid family serine protease